MNDEFVRNFKEAAVFYLCPITAIILVRLRKTTETFIEDSLQLDLTWNSESPEHKFRRLPLH
jgi:hypothetical protein